MEKKYELTDKTIISVGRTLYRIIALKSFRDIKAGDMGGFIEKETNLSQDGLSWVYGDAQVLSGKDYIVFKNWWSSGRYFTWTRSNDMWTAGCFHGTGGELVAKAYKDSEISRREYKRIVDYVESIKEIINQGRTEQ